MVAKKLYKFYKKYEGEILWTSIALFILYTFEIRNHLNIVQLELKHLEEKAQLSENNCAKLYSECEEIYKNFNQRLDNFEKNSAKLKTKKESN